MKVCEYPQREIPADLVSTALLSDADGTFFERGTTDLYPDAQAAIEAVNPQEIILVTANSDKSLFLARLRILDELDPDRNIDGIVPPRSRWGKYVLYREGAEKLRDDHESAAVLDDRWLAGVVMGTMAVRESARVNSVEQVLVRRYGARGDLVTDPILRKIEHGAYKSLRRMNPSLIDSMFPGNPQGQTMQG